MKLDLVKLRSMKDQITKHLEEYDQSSNHGMFCKSCGETDPEGGFYPTLIFTTGDLSGLLCGHCDKESRIVHTHIESK